MPSAAPNHRKTVAVPGSGDFSRACADYFDEIGRLWGLPPSVCRIYGLLYATPEPLSFSDIVERLEISKGSASQGLQFLCSLGAIRLSPASDASSSHSPVHLRSEANASRRATYVPETSLRRLVSGVLQERITPLASDGADRLAQLRELAERDGSASDFCLDRVRQLETWRRQLKTVLPMLSVLLGPKNKK